MATTNTKVCIVCKKEHPIYACNEFRLKPLKEKYSILRKHNICTNCLKTGHTVTICKSQTCSKCSKKHNSILHEASTFVKTQSNNDTNKQNENHNNSSSNITSQNNGVILAAHNTVTSTNYILLSTVKIKIVAKNGREFECRAILDSGSQMNLITDRLVKKLSLNPTEDLVDIHGIGDGKQRSKHRINVLIKSRLTGYETNMEAHVLSKITNYHPSTRINMEHWRIPKNIQLADPDFYRPDRVDLLIGAENFYQLLSVGQIKLGAELPILQNTVFGWVVSGKITNTETPVEVTCGICTQNEADLNTQIERFWKLEEPEMSEVKLSKADLKCEAIFNQTTYQREDGRFVVKLPFAQQPEVLGNSKEVAVARLLSMERKFKKNPKIKSQYVNFMREYLELGHMTEIKTIPNSCYFLPHHCVIKPDSSTTKLRVVFDGSSRTSTNTSLNDILYSGPKIQDDLFTILLRFRLPKYVFTADIEKMYRQVIIDKEDRNYQLIVWRENENQPIKYYQLHTVTYGITSAPYLAVKCLQKLASQNNERYPLGAACIRENFYVDDTMAGGDDIREALDKQAQVNVILKSAGFKLRKWCANHPSLLQGVIAEDKAPELELHEDNECQIKTLGLSWLPKTDEFQIKVKQTQILKGVTKRKILSEIAQLFDPLGILSPVVVVAKLLLQNLWSLKIDWDAAVPIEVHSAWNKFRSELIQLNEVKIPRHVFANNIIQSAQLHAFCDASEKAYGAVLYIRSVLKDGRVIVRLLCSKTRIAPLKKTTIPRLELCAAKLSSELVNRVKVDLKWTHPCYYWSDSTITLGWISSPSAQYQTFVANRISTIQDLTNADQWYYVPSKENPADVLSRGTSPEGLKNNTIWFYGPLFLHGSEGTWPKKPSDIATDLEKKQSKISLQITNCDEFRLQDIRHNNSFFKLQRIIAYVKRFIDKTRFNQEHTGPLLVDELEAAHTIIVRTIQIQGFSSDYQCMKKEGHVDSKSSILSLSPFLDKNGIIRVGGRLEKANISYDAKHPILLPYGHEITKIIITDLHIANSHAGQQTLLAIIRQRYWPINGKTAVRSIIQNCVRCCRSKPKLLNQFMGNLPTDRVQPTRPFLNAGVDFCGPFFVQHKIRTKGRVKSYVCIFCCFSTKAVHIEVVSDLTTEAFIGALKRFIARRGHCRKLYCDNATNFVGAKNQLLELQNSIFSKQSAERISTMCTSKGIDFHFIPPKSPHFGGLWEAAVKSAKHLFERNITTASLTYEELETVMVEIEAILNSRPLTPLSSDANDLTALTPGHFLIGEPLTSIVDPHAHPVKGNLLYRWKLVSELKNEFWQRWTKEYLAELQHRFKWKTQHPNIQPGLMVILKEDNLPVLSWPLGRVIEVIKGSDGIVRVAMVKTMSGVLKRPIHRLAPLPIQQHEQNTQNTGPAKQYDNSLPEGIPSTQNKKDQTKIKRPVETSLDEDNSSVRSNEEGQRGVKRQKTQGINPVSLFLMTCLILPIFGSTHVVIEPFKTNPGLYFEGMGSTQLISNEWNIVIHFNMDQYWHELDLMREATNYMSDLCKKMMNKQSCESTIAQFAAVIVEIDNGNELLYPQNYNRIKRAPLDIIGNIAGALFGVLDSTYAEKLSNIINNLEGNQQYSHDLVKNLTSIVDSTANILKQSHYMMEQHIQEFHMYMNETMSIINELQEQLYDQKLIEIFNMLSTRLILAITNYQRMQSALLDVLIDTHHGKVNPLLLTPNQLQTQLTVIRDHLQPSLRLPSAENHLLEFYNLMSIEGRLTTNHAIFRLRLPLLSAEQYELLRVIPIPAWINGTYVSIEPDTRYLIVNIRRDSYYIISEPDLEKCLIVGKTTHICMQGDQLLNKGSQRGDCEFSILTQGLIPLTCKIVSSSKSPRWIPLKTPNSWIYVTAFEDPVTIICNSTISHQTLKGTGIATIPYECMIRDNLTTIQSHNIHTSLISSSFVPSKDFINNLHPSQLTHMNLNLTNSSSLKHNITVLSEQIQELKNQETKISQGHHYHVHHFLLGYSTILIIIIIILYLIHHWYRQRRKHQRPVAAPRKATLSNVQQEFQLQSIQVEH